MAAAAVLAGAATATAGVVEDVVIEPRRIALASGGAGLVSYELDRTFTAPAGRGTPLPPVRVPRGDAFRGAFADNVFMAAWLTPEGKRQFQFDGELVENAHLLSRFANDAVPVAAGERYRSAFAHTPFDAPLDWERPRGSATGALKWDAAVDVRRISGVRNGTETTSDVLFVRADLVARGGDVDARSAPVAAPQLVIDLPRKYPEGTVGAFNFTVSLPYTTYVNGLRAQVDPEAGTATLDSAVNGYLPHAREVTTPGGKEIKEWHLPVSGVIVLGETAPAVAVPQVAVPKGGIAVVGDSTGRSTTMRAAPSGGDGEPGPSASTEELAAAADVSAATLTTPRTLRTGDNGHVMTLDPDFRRSGALAFTGLRRAATGTAFADAISVPFVRVGGETIALTADKLTDLRVYPQIRIATIGFTGFGVGDAARPLHDARYLQTSAFDAGFRADAYYDLGGGRRAEVSLQARSDDSGPAEVEAVGEVRFLDGPAQPAAPVLHVELPAGAVAVGGEPRATEFGGPLAENTPLTVGDRALLATGGPATVTVTRAGDAPAVDPRVRDRRLEGRPVTITYSAGAPEARTRLQLARDGEAPVADPPPLGSTCGATQATDAAGDAPPGSDVRSVSLSDDAANLYATMELDQVPAQAPPQTTLSWITHVRSDHEGHYVRAYLDAAGAWRFVYGPNNIEFSTPSYFGAENPTTGEADGRRIRIALPRHAFRGTLIRDVSARSVIRTPVAVREPDIAPDGSRRVHGLGGSYRLGECRP